MNQSSPPGDSIDAADAKVVEGEGMNPPPRFPKHGVRLFYFTKIIDTVCQGKDNINGLTRMHKVSHAID